MTVTREPRGAYAKGVAKREEILERALDVVAREGYRGASIQELAQAVGLSKAGLLHYFGSKEELFAEIVRKRDELDADELGTPGATDAPTLQDLRDRYVAVVTRNAKVPGLVQLFSQLAVEAADPDHPAHAYFVNRGSLLRDTTAAQLAAYQARGEVTNKIDPATLARLLQALTDGLQVQWMQEQNFDMAQVMTQLFDAITE